MNRSRKQNKEKKKKYKNLLLFFVSVLLLFLHLFAGTEFAGIVRRRWWSYGAWRLNVGGSGARETLGFCLTDPRSRFWAIGPCIFGLGICSFGL
ncbi:hypothetical protein ES319_A10G034000v1 [Gossypium barbadense]|uniref:Uncharacterized protein n=1 Tax=Gossypium barbadense TaxID=3634 RepID=A0A5J5TYT0_GOSBA|nr:hypothetical protein ES319_A10G034000v1 [Gossypium barbadense]